MSFGESMFSAKFNQKTVKGDLFIKGINQKTIQEALHRGRPHVSDMWGRSAPPRGCLAPVGPTCHPLCYVGSPPPPRMPLNRYFKLV